MFLTTILRAKAKSRNVMVAVDSVASGHRLTLIRERLADKMELIRFDPLIQMDSLYKEVKKIKSVRIVFREQKARPTNWVNPPTSTGKKS